MSFYLLIILKDKGYINWLAVHIHIGHTQT